MLKEVAVKTNDVAGDGTTTATVLAQPISNEGIKAINKGSNPMILKRYRFGSKETIEFYN